MANWVAFVLTVVSLPTALLVGSPLHGWIAGKARGDTVTQVGLWLSVFLGIAAGVVGIAWFLRFVERLILRRRAAALDALIAWARLCRQDGIQLQVEAASEQNNEVDFQHYCEMARILGENLDLVWRAGDASVLALTRKGLDLAAIEALMDAAHRHYDVEIQGPLGTNPRNQSDKIGRIRDAGFGGRCTSLLCGQLIATLSRVKADLGLGETSDSRDGASQA